MDGASPAFIERCRPDASFAKLLGDIQVAVEIGFVVDLTYVAYGASTCLIRGCCRESRLKCGRQA